MGRTKGKVRTNKGTRKSHSLRKPSTRKSKKRISLHAGHQAFDIKGFRKFRELGEKLLENANETPDEQKLIVEGTANIILNRVHNVIQHQQRLRQQQQQ